MPDNGDYIADYLSGSLSPEEMKAFEARLATDEELNREFQLLSKGMDYLKARSMKEEIENDPDLPGLDKEYEAYFSEKKVDSSKPEPESPPAGRKIRRTILRTLQAAVFIAALLVIRSILFGFTAVKLYDKYYDPLSRSAIDRQLNSDSANASVLAGIDCYLLEDYVCAINHLVEVPEGSFILGMSQLGLKQYASALKSLQTFQASNPDIPDVNWYLGLTYLRLDDLDEAVASLNKVSTTSNPYSTKAEKLIGKIERIKAAR